MGNGARAEGIGGGGKGGELGRANGIRYQPFSHLFAVCRVVPLLSS